MFLLLGLSLLASFPADVPSRLPVIRAAPDFALTTPEGETVSRGDLKERVWLVSFVFTTCNGSCPATTHRMAQVQEALKTRGLTRDGRVRLVSVTLDPARDTPEVLRNYRKLYDVDPMLWSFLTGPRETVERAIAAWGMWVKPAANGQLDHPSRIYLVDGAGRIREIYNLAFLKTPWVIEDVELLLKELPRK